MFTVELKINGALIGHVYGRNEGVSNKGLTKYRYEYYAVESRQIRNGEVWHDPLEGLNKLVASILLDATSE